jgi:hypothetical protein
LTSLDQLAKLRLRESEVAEGVSEDRLSERAVRPAEGEGRRGAPANRWVQSSDAVGAHHGEHGSAVGG